MGSSHEDASSFRSNISPPLDIMVAAIYLVFGVCSLLGNTTLLLVSYRKKQLLKPAEFFLLNLAVSDLGLTLSLFPMAITSSFYHRWLYGQTVCSLYAFCGMLFGLCSLTTLTVLSLVCFVKVCYPLYGNRFKSVHGRLLIACAWVYALLFASSPLLHWGEYGPEPYGTACCIDWRRSNERSSARSYTVALFVFCYILPCCAIAASYTGILLRVQASRKTMERHAARHTHMSRIQTIIVKLSVAVCIGFLVAWSPYAIVSMWAAFGHVDTIPPMAFAMTAMFAKSSTIYNPVIYLTLRPNFRRTVRRDLAALCRRAWPTRCLCRQGSVQCCSEPEIRVRLHTIHRQPSSDSAPQAPAEFLRGGQCKDPFQCYKHYPRMCGGLPGPAEDSSKGPRVLQTQEEEVQRVYRKNSLLSSMCAKTTEEQDDLHISVELVPGHAKVAWP